MEAENRKTQTVVLNGNDLTISKVVQISRFNAKVELTQEEKILRRVEDAHDYIIQAARAGKAIYGVTTGFGGMAHTLISPEDAAELQENLIWFMKTDTGRRIPNRDVRAAMVIRANTHLLGFSGLRMELIRRMEIFLNANVTPHVREFGSIGASGDLTPLACITGALIGLDKRFMVDFDGVAMDSLTALERLGLPRLQLRPKEGLAMINGTSVMSGIAVNCVYDSRILLALTIGAHALAIQGLGGTNQSFHPFIHAHKPHPGQKWAAARMLDLLTGSTLIRDELKGRHDPQKGQLIQDRYSLRCLPQFLGPMVEGLAQISRQVTVEINSATDNPLIDADHAQDLHGGNFLGQYIGVAMDHLRYYIGLIAKHLDAQIALLTAAEFNNGLPPSLIGNPRRKVNMGLKGLQINGNSIMPVLTFLGNTMVDRFPTHAEQFNQNINSQGMGAANLARQSTYAFQRYMATALMFGVQAVDLRTKRVAGHFDARRCLSPATLPLYEAVRDVAGQPPSEEKPYIRNDNEQTLSDHIQRIAADIEGDGRIPEAVRKIRVYGDTP
ncbi:MAG: aromatic amino acid ammonia-lyase [Desulfosarcinaceae bacterium]